ncbi:MAG: tRNA pseudouridine(38-40) synthase TruA [Lactobacillales bacterium]|nr:tRNA pseudouridine(38-40) synthase TruA [Lactobacillales bacterium]
MRYKIIIEYDGSPFSGWQRQADNPSIQEVLENALKICARQEVTVFGSGRTDAGVHAVGQVAHFDLNEAMPPEKLCESLNALVRPHPISIKEVTVVPDTFHARFDARQRTYVYKIQNTPYPPALLKGRVWWLTCPLDVESMNAAAALLIGKHDLSTFRDSQCQSNSPVKTIDEIKLYRQGELVLMEIKARSFLHHQVRNIIGSLVNVGMRKWSVEDFKTAFAACDRTKGGQTAPAEGLYFIAVSYG